MSPAKKRARIRLADALSRSAETNRSRIALRQVAVECADSPAGRGLRG